MSADYAVTMYSPETFEPWDHRNPDTVGIGGSETALICMAEGLAARGHSVTVYAPIPADTPTPHKGVQWHHIDDADWSRPGHWIISRAPEIADQFSLTHPGQYLWLICQDEDYPRRWEADLTRMPKFNRIVALCKAQADQFRQKYPSCAGAVCQSSNGLRTDLVTSVLAENLPRDPTRLIYTSSPDRGLESLLYIHQRLREYEPTSTLHVCYGFDNIDKNLAEWETLREQGRLPGALDRRMTWLKGLKEQLRALPGVVHHGRMPQRELYRQIAQASLWVYCSNFRETNCITSFEQQALGAIPIVSPLWAVGENVGHGVHVPGDANKWSVQSKFVGEAFQLLLDPERMEEIRRAMMPWAVSEFGYERWVAQWAGWMAEDLK